MNLFYCTPEVTCFANDNDALIPELWAMAALRTLRSNMVMGNLVNRDFDDMVKNHGDVVNTSRPADFSAKRKTDSDSVTNQDAESPNIQVPLDQHLHVSFTIKDGEMSKAMPDLVTRYLEPAARELAEQVDKILCGQVVRLWTYHEGRMGEMSAANADDFVIDANTQLDINRCPKAGRNMILNPRAQKQCLKADLFVSAEKRGDEGTALRTASLGTVYGMDAYMDQNVPYVALSSADYDAGDTDNAEAAGSVLIETDVADATEIEAGCFFTVEGSGEPLIISSIANDPIDITPTAGLKTAVGASSTVNVYTKGEVDLTAGYAAGWAKEIVVDGHTANKGPQVGQMVAFGTGASRHTYCVLEATVVTTTESSILLDRPLAAAIADGDSVYYGPAGGMNLCFHKDALTLVTRPLVTVPSDSGCKCFVASYDGLAMRVTMQYQGTSQGMLVTFDLLCGVAVLDARLACALWS
jgi:hypothetical protein